MTYTSEARPSGKRLSAALGLATSCAVLFCAAPALGANGSGGVGMGGGGNATPTATTAGGGGGGGGGGGAQDGAGTRSPTRGMTTPGATAKLQHGFAIPPAGAPRKVVRAIEAANEIVKGKPYCMGGGHARRKSRCYDCSGSISYALTGAGLLDSALPSGSFMNWERRGRGRWITIYANGGHMYAVIAGLRLDTSMTAGDGPGWSTEMRSGRGYAKRHPRHL